MHSMTASGSCVVSGLVTAGSDASGMRHAWDAQDKRVHSSSTCEGQALRQPWLLVLISTVTMYPKKPQDCVLSCCVGIRTSASEAICCLEVCWLPTVRERSCG